MADCSTVKVSFSFTARVAYGRTRVPSTWPSPAPEQDLVVIPATSLPMPSTVRSSLPGAPRIRFGVSKTSSSFRSCTGPIVGSILSAMHASADVIVLELRGTLKRKFRRHGSLSGHELRAHSLQSAASVTGSSSDPTSYAWRFRRGRNERTSAHLLARARRHVAVLIHSAYRERRSARTRPTLQQRRSRLAQL